MRYELLYLNKHTKKGKSLKLMGSIFRINWNRGRDYTEAGKCSYSSNWLCPTLAIFHIHTGFHLSEQKDFPYKLLVWMFFFSVQMHC